MGICPRCDKLVHIAPRGFTTHPVRIVGGVPKQCVSDRQLAWFPVFHDDEDGEPCEGAEREIK